MSREEYDQIIRLKDSRDELKCEVARLRAELAQARKDAAEAHDKALEEIAQWHDLNAAEFDALELSQFAAYHQDCAAAIRALDAVRAAKLPFPLGARVRKKSGSQWQGRVVGYYSASRTQNGIAVESEREIGNVQVYPAEAFEIVSEETNEPS